MAQRVEDLDRAVELSTVLREAEPVSRSAPPAPQQAFFVLDGGTRLMLSPQSPASMLYLHVDNVHAALERLEGLADVVTAPQVVTPTPTTGSARSSARSGRRSSETASATSSG